MSEVDASQKRNSVVGEYPQRPPPNHHDPTASSSSAIQESLPAASVNVVAVMRRTVSQSVPTVSDCVGSSPTTATGGLHLTGVSDDAAQPEASLVQTAQYVAPSKIMTRPAAGPRRVANSPYAKLQSYAPHPSSSAAGATSANLNDAAPPIPPPPPHYHHAGPLPLSSTPLSNDEATPVDCAATAVSAAASSERFSREQPPHELGIDERYDAVRSRIFGSADKESASPLEGLALDETGGSGGGGEPQQRHNPNTSSSSEFAQPEGPFAGNSKPAREGSGGLLVNDGANHTVNDSGNQDDVNVREGSSYMTARGGGATAAQSDGGLRGRGHRKTKHAPRGAVSADEQHEYRRSHVAYGMPAFAFRGGSMMMTAGSVGAGVGGGYFPHSEVSSNQSHALPEMANLPPYPMPSQQLPHQGVSAYSGGGGSFRGGGGGIPGTTLHHQNVGVWDQAPAADEYSSVPNEGVHPPHVHQQRHHHHHHMFLHHGAPGFAPNGAVDAYAPLSSPPPPHAGGSVTGAHSAYPASSRPASVGQSTRYDEYSNRMPPGAPHPVLAPGVQSSDASSVMPYSTGSGPLQYAQSTSSWTPPPPTAERTSYGPPPPPHGAIPGVPPPFHPNRGGPTQPHPAYPTHHNVQQQSSWLTNSSFDQPPYAHRQQHHYFHDHHHHHHAFVPQPQLRNWSSGSGGNPVPPQQPRPSNLVSGSSASSQPQSTPPQQQQQQQQTPPMVSGGGGNRPAAPYDRGGGGGVVLSGAAEASLAASRLGAPAFGLYGPPLHLGSSHSFGRSSGDDSHQLPQQQQQQQLPHWTAGPSSPPYPPLSPQMEPHSNWQHSGNPTPHWKPSHFPSPHGFAEGASQQQSLPVGDHTGGGHTMPPSSTYFNPPSRAPPPPPPPPPPLATSGSGSNGPYPTVLPDSGTVPSVVVGFARHHQPVVTVSGRAQQLQQPRGGGVGFQLDHHRHHISRGGRGDGSVRASFVNGDVTGTQDASRSGCENRNDEQQHHQGEGPRAVPSNTPESGSGAESAAPVA